MFVKPDVGSSGFQKHLDNSKKEVRLTSDLG